VESCYSDTRSRFQTVQKKDYVYDGFYVFDFIAHCWATFSAHRALLSSHIMTNKNDDDDDDLQSTRILGKSSFYEHTHAGTFTPFLCSVIANALLKAMPAIPSCRLIYVMNFSEKKTRC